MPRIHRTALTVDASVIDVNQHVSNLAYLRWMQEVAIEHSAAQGWPVARYLETRSGWVVRSHQIEYLRPAFLGEALTLFTWVADLRRRSSRRRYLFWRQADGQVLATAETDWVFVDGGSGRPLPIPAALAGAFEVVPQGTDVLAELGLGGDPPRRPPPGT
jgi:acyl-CoA thioester hydrolase